MDTGVSAGPIQVKHRRGDDPAAPSVYFLFHYFPELGNVVKDQIIGRLESATVLLAELRQANPTRCMPEEAECACTLFVVPSCHHSFLSSSLCLTTSFVNFLL